MSGIHEILINQDNVNDDSVTLIEIYFNNGDTVEKDQVILDYETSKAVNEIVAPCDGIVELYFKVGDDVNVGSVVGVIKSKENIEPDIADENKKEENSKVGDINKLISDKAAELIKEFNIDYAKLRVFGNNFITANDIRKLLFKNGRIIDNPENIEIKYENNSDMSIYKENEYKSFSFDIIKLSRIKKAEITSLQRVNSSSLISNVVVSINTGDVLPYIKKNCEYIKSTLAPIVLFEVSRLLIKYKELNSFFKNNEIAYYKDINLGYALDINDGLKAVNIMNANKKNITEIDFELYSLIELYTGKKLRIENIAGSTFSVTDLSTENVYSFFPLINDFQSCMLGMGSMDINGKQLFSLSFDHRVTSGKVAALFLNELKERLESYGTSFAGKKVDLESNKNIMCSRCMKTLKEDLELMGTGFIKVIGSDGKEVYLCKPCYMGY